MRRKQINIYTIHKFESLKKIIKTLAIIFTIWLLYKIISTVSLTTIVEIINDNSKDTTPEKAIIKIIWAVIVMIFAVWSATSIATLIENANNNSNHTKSNSYESE